MKQGMRIWRNVTMLTQFGLSLIVPLLLCLALCWWLNARVGIGVWIYLPGFFFGIGGSVTFFYKFYRSSTEKKEKGEEKEKVSFNRHL